MKSQKILPCRTGQRIFWVKLDYQENLSVRMSGPKRNNRKINQWYFAEKEGYVSKTLGIEGNHFLSLLFILPGNHNHRSASPPFQPRDHESTLYG